jgi:hypothetical protein
MNRKLPENIKKLWKKNWETKLLKKKEGPL